MKLLYCRYVKYSGITHGMEFQEQLIICSLKTYYFLSLMSQLSGNEREERKKYSILETKNLVGVLSAIFVAKTLNGFHKWDFVSMPNLHGLLSFKKCLWFSQTPAQLGTCSFFKKAYPAATGNIFLNTTVFYCFLIILKMNLTEIPTVLLHITQRSSFHLFTGEKLTELTHLEMM